LVNLLISPAGAVRPEPCHEKPIVISGANRMNEYLHILTGKRVAIVGNHTSLVNGRHLVDTLLSRNIDVVKIFGPEHGSRGNASDGAGVENAIDPSTNIPVISLYGKNRKPSAEDMQGIDIMLFDIQDVGCRFYTYISTLAYVMEACAETGIPLVLLDRPNPNGYYIDGPVLEPQFASFVGLHPVPIVYGMTIGEYARMVNGEKWLKNGIHCRLIVIECRKYTHETRYQLPVKPSPNLPTMNSVYLYPSLCLFEGTVVSVGRGTATPFEVIGHPAYLLGSYLFTPERIKGISDHPPHEGKPCIGLNLSANGELMKRNGQIELLWLIDMYNSLDLGAAFFTPYFDKLAGNSTLRQQITSGKSISEIRQSWQKELHQFRKIRNKYLLYPDNQ